MKKSLQRFMSLVLALILFFGSAASIYSRHHCGMSNNLKSSRLKGVEVSVCEGETKSCCSNNMSVSFKNCSKEYTNQALTTTKTDGSDYFFHSPAKPNCCVEISGYFGIPLFKTNQIENYKVHQLTAIIHHLITVPELWSLNADKRILLHPPDIDHGNNRLVCFQTFRI